MTDELNTSTSPDELQIRRERREKERAKWNAINARAKLKEQGKESVTEYGRELFNKNAETLTIALGSLLEELLENPNKPGPHFAAWPLLLHVTNRGPRPIAAIALGVVLDKISQRPTQRKLANAIGIALQDELKAGRVEKLNADLMRLIRKRKGNKALSDGRILEELKLDRTGWTTTQKYEVGSLLLQLIEARTKLIKTTYLIHRGRSKKIIEPTGEVLDVIEARPPIPFPARKLPMLVRPRKWDGMYGGGHLDNNLPLVRTRKGVDLNYLDRVGLVPVIDSVNRLQDQELFISPWMVETQRTAWDYNIRDLFPVQRDPKEPPPRPQDLIGPEAYQAWQKETLLAQKDRNDGAIDRQRIEQAITQCEEVAGRSVWFSYCADFRGRIYTSNRYATHQGPDWEKAAINFAKGEHCSTDGFEWMLKAAAGHYGIRGSWADRLEWGKNHIPEMISIAEDPLNKVELWRGAKDKWQYLQLCKAVADQKENKGCKSYVPIRFDQTCSGIGIAACLLRDRNLACHTNIIGEKQRDIYERVADALQYLLQLDLSNGTKFEQKKAEFWLDFGITREITKGPCMTTIYGAQFLGLVDGLVALLEDHQKSLRIGQWEYAYLSPARYLARKIRLLLGTELKSCLSLQNWLRTTTKKVLSEGKKMRWTTPMGLPIELGEQHDPRSNVNTLTQGKKRWQPWNERSHPEELSARTTNRAITANFCHSFDASLAQAMISKSGVINVPLLTNHDCFATNATNAGWLHHTLLDELRVLYATDWLTEIRDEICLNTGIKGINPVPVVGDLCCAEIGSNDYCFS